MATHRREKITTPASVLDVIESTGIELIKQCGSARAQRPALDVIPHPVLTRVLELNGDLLALLLKYATELAPKPEVKPEQVKA